MRKIKLLSLLISVIMLVSVIPIATASAEVGINNESALRAALLTENEITLNSEIKITSPIQINRDVVINFNDNVIKLNDGVTTDSIFEISGATVTLNNAIVNYSGGGSAYKLVGTNKATKLNINGGSHIADIPRNSMQLTGIEPEALFVSDCEVAAVKPEIVLNGGYYVAVVEGLTINDWIGTGAILSGDASLNIKEGDFRVNPEAYVDKDSFSYKTEYDEGYCVLAVDKETSDAFKAFLNAENKLEINRYKPAKNENLDIFYEALDMKYGFFDENDEPRNANFLQFHRGTYNYEESTIYASVKTPEWEVLETHKVQIQFNYDEKIKAEVDKIIATLPKGEDYGDWVDSYYYSVNDLELINYWLACKADDGSDDVFYYNTSQLINFSGEFKKYIGYKNFGLDPRMGDGGVFFRECEGIANFEYDGVAYAAEHIGARTDHILYVPDETENTPEALLAAAQKRVDEYVGEGKVKLELSDAATEALDQKLYFYYKNTEWEWHQWKPDATFEEWKNGPCCPSFTIEDLFEGIIENPTADTPCFKTTINGTTNFFVILRDSSKMINPPKYQSIDVLTNVTVSSDDGSIPLDTNIEVEKLTSGTEYDKIIKILDVEDNETFDIKLHSSIDDKYITKLDNGKFEVKIPIPQKFDGKKLIVYYVDSNDKVIEYEVTVKDGFAIFVTDHFSIYTLSEVKTLAEAPTEGNTTENNKAPDGYKIPNSGDNFNLFLWSVLALLSVIALASVVIFKKKFNK